MLRACVGRPTPVPLSRALLLFSTQATKVDATGTSSVKLKGATWDARAQKWKAVITVNGVRTILGSFSEAKQASDAYMAAKAVVKDEQYRTNRTNRDKRAPIAPATPPPSPTTGGSLTAPFSDRHPSFLGVVREPGVALWEAVITTADGKDISGGEYDSAEEAAKACVCVNSDSSSDL
jgi:hypothetical protein